jgi:hypothetical protein
MPPDALVWVDLDPLVPGWQVDYSTRAWRLWRARLPRSKTRSVDFAACGRRPAPRPRGSSARPPEGHGLLTPDETSFIADVGLLVDGGYTAE